MYSCLTKKLYSPSGWSVVASGYSFLVTKRHMVLERKTPSSCFVCKHVAAVTHSLSGRHRLVFKGVAPSL